MSEEGKDKPADPAANGEGDDKPQTVPYARFQELVTQKNAQAKQLDVLQQQINALTAAKKTEDDAKLAEQGKFQELAASAKKEADDWKGKYENEIVGNALRNAIRKAIPDTEHKDSNTEAVLRLIDRGAITKTADGFTGIDEAIKTVQGSYPVLFTAPAAAGNGGAGAGSGNPKPGISAAAVKSMTPQQISSMSREDFARIKQEIGIR